jgi:hypothetical protein
MSTIKTVGELRAVIADLPDDMPVIGYDGGDLWKLIGWWVAPVNNGYLDNGKHVSKGPETECLTLSTD